MQARARATDPTTSHDAAHTVTNIGRLQAHVLALFHALGDLTDHELIDHWRQLEQDNQYPPATDQSIRSRRAELVGLGRLRATDRIAHTSHGRRTTVWTLIQPTPGIPRQRAA